MKPTDLKYPFSWEERRPIISKKVLFIPEYYNLHHQWEFPGWENDALFGKQGKVSVEFCSGNGQWIIEKAKQSSEDLWVAVEKKFDRSRQIWSKMHNQFLDNLFLVCGEAYTFIREYLPRDSIDAAYINFPDPWPKLKHAKNRLIQLPFVDELARVMKTKGKIILVSDDFTYIEQMIDTMLQSCAWNSCFPSPHYVTQWENYGSSYFDRLWRDKGKTIYFLQFEKVL